MVDTRRVAAGRYHGLHDRTYAGNTVAKRLRDAESRRLSAHLKLRGTALQDALECSDLNAGPQTLFAGHLVLGDVLLVVPDEDHVQDVMTRLHEETTAANNQKIRALASGANFREWLISNVGRDDPTGDLATDVLEDESFPVVEHCHDAGRYLARIGASSYAQRALDDAWAEYASQYPERVHGVAWCNVCDQQIVELRTGLLAWDEYEGFRTLHFDCLDDDSLAHQALDELLDPKVLASRITDFIKCHSIYSDQLAELERLLHLWGFHRFRAASTSRVYFIQSGHAGPIKIGYSTNPVQQRLAALQTGHPEPLRVLAEVEGDRSVEADLHQRFRRHRMKGEWFRPDPELIAFIAVLRPD